MSIAEALGSWSLDPVPTVLTVLTGVGYLVASRRIARSRPGAAGARGRVGPGVCFGAGLLVVIVAVDGPPDVLSDSAFSVHMVQHVLLQMVAAPLLLLGGPVLLLLRADPAWIRRRVLVAVLRSRTVRFLSHPAVAFSLFGLGLVASHLTPFYEIALQHEWVHELEHLMYLATALLFWWQAIGVDPAPRRMSPPARLLYLFLAMPVPALLGVAIAQSGRVLYPYYAAQLPPWGGTALADQHIAGTLLWVTGMFTMVPALAVVLWRWLEAEDRRQERREVVAARSHGAGQVALPRAEGPGR